MSLDHKLDTQPVDEDGAEHSTGKTLSKKAIALITGLTLTATGAAAALFWPRESGATVPPNPSETVAAGPRTPGVNTPESTAPAENGNEAYVPEGDPLNLDTLASMETAAKIKEAATIKKGDVTTIDELIRFDLYRDAAIKRAGMTEADWEKVSKKVGDTPSNDQFVTAVDDKYFAPLTEATYPSTIDTTQLQKVRDGWLQAFNASMAYRLSDSKGKDNELYNVTETYKETESVDGSLESGVVNIVYIYHRQDNLEKTGITNWFDVTSITSDVKRTATLELVRGEWKVTSATEENIS